MVFLLRFTYFRYYRWPYSHNNAYKFILNFIFMYLLTILLVIRDLILKFYPHSTLPLHYTRKQDMIIGAILIILSTFLIYLFVGKEKDLTKMKPDEFGLLSHKPMIGTLVFWAFLIFSFAMPFSAIAIHHEYGFDNTYQPNQFIYHWDNGIGKGD